MNDSITKALYDILGELLSADLLPACQWDIGLTIEAGDPEPCDIDDPARINDLCPACDLRLGARNALYSYESALQHQDGYPDFDTVESVGLDGTLRDDKGAGIDGLVTWEQVARAALGIAAEWKRIATQ